MVSNQTLAGDSTDGYSGAPGFGVKTSQKFFEENGYTWNSVLEAFGKKGLTEEDALMNARLAKILTADDYDKGPILFTPPMPILNLTMEQEFKMRQLTDGVQKASKEDLITILLALQRRHLS